MPIDSDAHDFITKLSAYWILGGIVCLVLGEGEGPLVGAVLGVFVFAAIVGRMSRGGRSR